MTQDALYVLGAGGFALQMLDTLDQLTAQGCDIVVADDGAVVEMAGYPVVAVADVPSKGRAVIAISRPETRRLVARRRDDLAWDRLIAATAVVSRAAVLGPGAILAHGVVVEANCCIGRHFQANLYSYVAHECVIGDFVTMSPRVSCNGNVHIGDNVFIGTGVMIRQGRPNAPLMIGNDAFIGMGAIVTRDVPAGSIVKASATI